MEFFGELLIWLVFEGGECVDERLDIEIRPWWVKMLAWIGFIALIFGLLFLYLHLALLWGKKG